jgi:hypothetical protein
VAGKFDVRIPILGWVFLLTGGMQASAQLDSEQVAFIANWEEGDSSTFEHTYIYSIFGLNGLQGPDTMVSRSHWYVLEAGLTYYRIQFTYQKSIPEIIALLPAPYNELEVPEKRHLILPVIYRTDEFGRYRYTENWEELAELVETFFLSEMARIMANSQIPREQWLSNVEPVLESIRSRHWVESILLRDITYLHLLQGSVLDLNFSRHYVDNIPELFQQPSVAANAEIRLDSLAEDLAVVRQEILLDPAAGKQALEAYFQERVQDETKRERMLALSEGDFSEHQYFEIMLFTPMLPLKVVINRKTQATIDGSYFSREEIFFFRRLYPSHRG